MKLKPIVMKKQIMNEKMMKEALYACYENIAFSTFPYIQYKLKSSEKTLAR